MNAFSAWLSQSFAWHEKPGHSPGALASALSNVDLLNQYLFDRPLLVGQMLGGAAIGVLACVYFCWRVGLVALGCMPVVAFWAAMQLRATRSLNQSQLSHDISKFASECFENIRTVLVLGGLSIFHERLLAMIATEKSHVFRRIFLASWFSGLFEFSLWGSWALSMWFGGTMVRESACVFEDMLQAVSAILITTYFNGQIQVRSQR